MSINLKKVYFKKLEEYVGKKLNIVSNENEITIIYDVETSYVLQEEKEIFYFYCIQRNERIKIAEYYSEKEMETNFAIAIKGFFSEGIDYSGYNEAVYLKVILERVRGYEAIFEETLSEKEIYDIIK